MSLADFARTTRLVHREKSWGLSASQRKRLLRELAILIISLMVGALFYVWSRIEVIEKGYKISELKQSQKQLQETQHQLTLEAATLRSSERLEKIGRYTIHLDSPKPEQMIFLSEGDLKK
ncbi:MAG: cell division protein FtsL [bacterium]|nr:cell division protein FtsL [bacterium]